MAAFHLISWVDSCLAAPGPQRGPAPESSSEEFLMAKGRGRSGRGSATRAPSQLRFNNNSAETFNEYKMKTIINDSLLFFSDCSAFRAHAKENPPEGQTNPLWLSRCSSSPLHLHPPSGLFSFPIQQSTDGGFLSHQVTWDIFRGVQKPFCARLPQPPTPSGPPCMAASCPGVLIHVGRCGVGLDASS